MIGLVVRCGAVLAPLLPLSLIACMPSSYGVHGRLISIPAMPDMACIETTLRATPGVKVVHFTSGTERVLSLHQGIAKGQTYNWNYRVDDFNGNVHFRFGESHDNGEFQHSVTRTGTRLSEDEQAHVEAWAAQVNANLETACGVPVSNEPS